VSLFRRPVAEKRSIDSVPWNVGAPLGETPSQERALRLAPVYAAHRHLADNISTLPLKAYRRTPNKREPMKLPALFQFLADEGTLVDWVTSAVLSLASQGNAIGFITSRDDEGIPTAVMWRPRSEFTVDDSSVIGRALWHWRGRQVDREELLHIPWLTIPGRTLGLSPLEAAQLTVESGLKAQEYGNDWFAAGGVPPGTFKNAKQTVNQEDAAKIKGRLVRAIQSHEPIVYGSDWDFNPISIPPEQAQFVESQKLTANQVASIYGIAPEEVGGEAANSLTYSNEEMRQTTRLANLRPWLVRLEWGFSNVMPEWQYVKFLADAVIRADLKSRHEVYKTDREIGLMSINEIRALEDLPPIPGGEEYTPLQKMQQTPAPEADQNGST
jgi:HK97 family phage portal protein